MKGGDTLRKGSALINFSGENKPFPQKGYNFKKRALTSNIPDNRGLFYTTVDNCNYFCTVISCSVLDDFWINLIIKFKF